MEEVDFDEESPVDVVGRSLRNAYFDEIIGHIEDIVLSDDFAVLHSQFLEKNWKSFDDMEENRLEYMDIFLEYVRTFEQFLVEQLHKRMDSFDMQQFATELREANLTSEYNHDEIFELLHTFNSFQAFKDLMLDYRRSKERKSQNIDFEGILITKPMKILKKNGFL